MHQSNHWNYSNHGYRAQMASNNMWLPSGTTTPAHFQESHVRTPSVDYSGTPSQATSVSSSTGSWKEYERPMNEQDLGHIAKLGWPSIFQSNQSIVPSSVVSENFVSLNDSDNELSRPSTSHSSSLNIRGRNPPRNGSPPRHVSPSISSFSRPSSPSNDAPSSSSRQSTPPISFINSQPHLNPAFNSLANKVAHGAAFASSEPSSPVSNQPLVLLKILHYLRAIPAHSVEHAIVGMELMVDLYHHESAFLRALVLRQRDEQAQGISQLFPPTPVSSSPTSQHGPMKLHLVGLNISKLEELSDQLTIAPPDRPPQFSPSVLWFRADAIHEKCYHNNNQSHLIPKKIIRNKDGTALPRALLDSMERSTERIANVLYTAFSPDAPSHKGRGKGYYSRFFNKAYLGAICAIEIICPEATYCADHYKAESALQGALDSVRSKDTNRHLEFPPTCPYVPTVPLNNPRQPATRTRPLSDSSNLRQQERPKAVSKSKAPAPSQILSSSVRSASVNSPLRRHPASPPVVPKSPRILNDHHQSHLLSPARPPFRHIRSTIGTPGATPKRATKRTNEELASTPSPARIQAKRLKQPSAGQLPHDSDNDEHMDEPQDDHATANPPANEPTSPIVNDSPAGIDSNTSSNSNAQSEQPDIEWIQVSSSFSGLQSYLQSQAKKNSTPSELLAAALEVVSVLGRIPFFQRTEPSPKVSEFLDRLTKTTPADVDEDNTNESWGHHQFTAGVLQIDSVIKSWSDVGSVGVAFELLSASLRICSCARHICYHNGVRINPADKRLLADDYLEKLMKKLPTEGFTSRFLSPTLLEPPSEPGPSNSIARPVEPAPASDPTAVTAPDTDPTPDATNEPNLNTPPPSDAALLKALRLPALKSLCVTHSVVGYKSSLSKDLVIEKILQKADRGALMIDAKTHLPPPNTSKSKSKSKSRKA
ncbi:hypothetical protein ONZ45_g14487 [Pleurotus djamor]|nr:hypothetical protein ONZ45_g14487 [Pleurotus djamor]